jgi:hypothetical protein
MPIFFRRRFLNVFTFLSTFLFALSLFPKINQVWAATYYVDSSTGSDSNSCTAAQSTSTPRRTVSGIMNCNPGAGDIVKFRGTFTQAIEPNRSGQVLYPFQAIQRVSGSTVTFNQSVSGLNPATDYVTIYNSRKGNSGAFAVISFSGNSVTVDTSSLPLASGSFIFETASDPGDLHAAILRPVHFTAWDKDNPPIFDTSGYTFLANGKSVLMASYIHSISGLNVQVWPAFKIDSTTLVNSDFFIFDHLEIENAAVAIFTESSNFQSDYDIIQYNNIHHTGFQGGASDEMIYFGQDTGQPVKFHSYVQIMYNKIGPHRFTSGVRGDGIEIKETARNATIFGNEIFGIQNNACSDAPLRISGNDAFVANNYIHDISPTGSRGCGITVTDDYPSNPDVGGKRTILANNIIANVRWIGIEVLGYDVQVLNNTIYNILPETNDCDTGCMERNAGIMVWNYFGPTQNALIRNNIVDTAYIGIGRYIYNTDNPQRISSDYNVVFNATYPFRGTITQNTHDLITNPRFVNPTSGDFHLQSSSPAINAGVTLSDVTIDFDGISRPQGAGYDIGVYEYVEGAQTIHLSQGWNEIVWAADSAGKRASDVPSECPMAVVKESLWFRSYVRDYGGVNFGFESGRSYYLRCNREVTWSL